MPDLSRRKFVALGGGALGGAVAGVAGGPARAEAAVQAVDAAVPGGGSEPDIELAKLWWPDPRNMWAPIGWKDSLFRFNVVYNGSVIAAPRPLGRFTKAVEGYGGQGIQLDMNPWGGWFTGPGPLNPLYASNFYLYREDYGLYGHGTQRWAANPTPVLQTDWPQSNGVVLRQSVFAHSLGGADVVRGDEPLFAWIRLSVAYVNPLDSPPAPIGFAIRVCRPYYFQQYPYRYQDGVTLTGNPALAPFPEGRWTVPTSRPGQTGYKVWQPQGPRLAVLTSHAQPTFTRPQTDRWIYSMQVQLPPVVGAHTDILVSMLPAYEPNLNQEIALGYDGALADADRYWSRKPTTAATVDTPETHVNEAIRRNIQFSEVVTQKSPATGQPTFLTGSYGYDVLWSTPTSMTSHMFLDLLGYHDTVARHIDLYRTGQGTTGPPGPAYPQHPGYYGTPADLKAVNWITDHGAVMETVARHALLTGDQAFITTWRDSLVKACDFIKAACSITNHPGIKGLPPPAVATDEDFETQSVWNMAWLYKGLTSAIELLRLIGHARAEEFATVAASFKSVFIQAFDNYGAQAPKWTHPNGQRYPVYSPNLIPPDSGGFGEIVRLDAGPMVLVWAGLFDAADDRMSKFADYFRYGPNATLYGTGNRKNALDRPVLIHEMSSCEPIYSWNVFHSWQTGDRPRFLEGMYSLLAGGLSPQTYVPFEHRHGMSAMPGPNATAFWLVRHAVLDDSIKAGELHLLRLCPLAWLTADRDAVFGAMPTLFGPVNLRFRRGSGTTLTLTWSGTWRRTPAKVVVHAPPGITQLVINGTTYAVPPSRQVEVPTG